MGSKSEMKRLCVQSECERYKVLKQAFDDRLDILSSQVVVVQELRGKLGIATDALLRLKSHFDIMFRHTSIGEGKSFSQSIVNDALKQIEENQNERE